MSFGVGEVPEIAQVPDRFRQVPRNRSFVWPTSAVGSGKVKVVVEVCEISKITSVQNVFFRRPQLRRPLYSGRRNPRTPVFLLQKLVVLANYQLQKHNFDFC